MERQKQKETKTEREERKREILRQKDIERERQKRRNEKELHNISAILCTAKGTYLYILHSKPGYHLVEVTLY